MKVWILLVLVFFVSVAGWAEGDISFFRDFESISSSFDKIDSNIITSEFTLSDKDEEPEAKDDLENYINYSRVFITLGTVIFLFLFVYLAKKYSKYKMVFMLFSVIFAVIVLIFSTTLFSSNPYEQGGDHIIYSRSSNGVEMKYLVDGKYISKKRYQNYIVLKDSIYLHQDSIIRLLNSIPYGKQLIMAPSDRSWMEEELEKGEDYFIELQTSLIKRSGIDSSVVILSK